MSSSYPNIPDPGQYWPEAEAMLDGHFRGKRRRRFLIWFFLLIGLVSSWIFVQERASDTRDALKSVSTVQNIESALPSEQNGAVSDDGSTDYKAQLQSDQESQNTITSASASNDPQQIAQRPVKLSPNRNTKPSLISVQTSVQQNRQRKEPIDRNQNANPREENKASKNSVTEELNQYEYTENNQVDPIDECEDVTANFYGEVDPGYIDRRRLEETPCLSPSLSVQWFNTRGNWDIRVGAGISQWGEESAYSPYTRQTYTNTSSVWQPYNYTLVDTDSAYVYGMLYYQTSNIVVNDSVLVTTTDTLYGLLPDTSLAGSLPCVKHTLIQIPIEIAWTRQIGKFGIGISAGISIGWLIRSTGSYLRADQAGLVDWNGKGRSGIFMQAGTALEFSYRIRDRISILLLPAGNTALTSVNEPLGLKKRYSAWGLQAGLRFVLD
ncbi:MAG: hypothetical protein LW707_03825 [Sphingobacteriales bacterium]|nr:hypothetical protein [Sphingobacteriales bacterium]